MRHEARHVVPCLGDDLRAERLLFAVRRTGEEEVLPDHETALVALLVEVVGLEDAAAPHAQQVETCVLGLREPGRVALPGDPVREGVVRYPVGALHEDGAVVHHEGEARPVLVGAHVQPHRTEADAGAPPVEPIPGAVHVAELDTQVVEALATVASWPPALDVVNRQGDHAGRLPCAEVHGCCLTSDLRRDDQRTRDAGALDLDVDLHGPPVA
jgi:hypothetical protein